MPDDLASSNVNRSFSLSATSIAIFTFTLVFLYPRFAAGEIDGVLFQAALIVMGIATFCLALASVHYYGSSLVGQINEDSRWALGRRGDDFWGAGYYLLFLSPSLILFTVGLTVVGTAWLGLWALALLWGIRNFPSLRRQRKEFGGRA
jgi:hypothetical protein